MELGGFVLKIVSAAGISAIVLVILNLIKVKPFEIDVFGWIGKAFMKSTNDKIDALNMKIDLVGREVDDLKKDYEDHVVCSNRDAATRSRRHIINFNSEIMRNMSHTEEQYNQILEDIDNYEQYCVDDPDYQNTKAVESIANIKRAYRKRLEKNDFLN